MPSEPADFFPFAFPFAARRRFSSATMAACMFSGQGADWMSR